MEKLQKLQDIINIFTTKRKSYDLNKRKSYDLNNAVPEMKTTMRPTYRKLPNSD